LIRAHVRPVRLYLAARLPAVHLRDELAHEVFVIAFRKIRDFVPESSFEAWIRVIAWQLVRRERLRFASEQQNMNRLAEHLAAARDVPPPSSDPLIEHLEECLQLLPRTLRDLLNEKYLEGRSSNEIAAGHGKSAEWVRTTLYRIRGQLRECIRRKGSASGGASIQAAP
jgi:RNA polymerase sigma-70 factor (ECF subfamily)